MLQVRSQESYLDYKMQEMPRQPNEAKEQDAGSQEVSKASMSLRASHNILRVPLFKYKQSQHVNNLLLCKEYLRRITALSSVLAATEMVNCLLIDYFCKFRKSFWWFHAALSPVIVSHSVNSSLIGQKWMGRDLNSRPPVCETGILTRLDYPSAFLWSWHNDN